MMEKNLIIIAFIGILNGCASNPNKIDATYVSPLKYSSYNCLQLTEEMDYVGQRTTKLYHRLKKERKADNWAMGIGLVLFWPSLFLLEGGDGPEASEYAQLKGEFTAIRTNSVRSKCSITMKSPEEIMKEADENSKKNNV